MKTKDSSCSSLSKNEFLGYNFEMYDRDARKIKNIKLVEDGTFFQIKINSNFLMFTGSTRRRKTFTLGLHTLEKCCEKMVIIVADRLKCVFCNVGAESITHIKITNDSKWIEDCLLVDKISAALENFDSFENILVAEEMISFIKNNINSAKPGIL